MTKSKTNLCDSAPNLKFLDRPLPFLLFGPREDSFLWVQVHHCLLAEAWPDVWDQRLRKNSTKSALDK